VISVEHDTPDEPPPPASCGGGRLDGGKAELGSQVVGDRPAEKATRAGVDDRCEIQPALIGPDVGGVADPELVELYPLEVSPDQVESRDLGGVTAGRAYLAPARTAAKALAGHLSLDGLVVDQDALSGELGGHTWRSIATSGALVHPGDVTGDLGSRELARARRTGFPRGVRVEARCRDSADPTKGPDREVGLLGSDEREDPHARDSFTLSLTLW
jgi:hypothetical protein